MRLRLLLLELGVPGLAGVLMCVGCAGGEEGTATDSAAPSSSTMTPRQQPTAPTSPTSNGENTSEPAPSSPSEEPAPTPSDAQEQPEPVQPSSPGAPGSPQPSDATPDPDNEPPSIPVPATATATATPEGPTEEQTSIPGVLQELEEYLAAPAQERGPISDQAFANQALSREDTEQAASMLWEDRAALVQQQRAEEHDARSLSYEEFTLIYDFTVFGEEPVDGRSLYLSLHGGGNAEPSVNDQQWENQKQLYQPEEGVYLSPRAPTNTWNLWHEAHIDPLFQRLITNFIVMENVNPNKVYVMGYSAGGDGVYQLGPRMADYWAAASAMAGHPNEAQPFSLRNIGFTIHVGELDTAYDRNLIAVEWDDKLNELQSADPEGYIHYVEVHPGKPHWMDLEDAVAVPWMAQFTRNPAPKKVVWYQDDITHESFYWLATTAPLMETTIVADIEGQTVKLSSSDVDEVIVRLSDDLLNLDMPVTVVANDDEVFMGVVERNIATLAKTLDAREDPELMWSGEIVVELP